MHMWNDLGTFNTSLSLGLASHSHASSSVHDILLVFPHSVHDISSRQHDFLWL